MAGLNVSIWRRPVISSRAIFLLVMVALCGGGSALAEDAGYDPQSGSETQAYQIPHTGLFKGGKVYLDNRYRYEFVDQANLPKDARASTLKNKTGVESGYFYGFRAGVEGEFVVEIGPDDFNNTINGKTSRPVVADVQSAELDQAWLESHHIRGVTLLGGRYLENLDNLRYVGSVAWRQNDQTFDGAKVTVTRFPGVTGLYAYIGNVNRIFGDRSPAGNINSNTCFISKARR